ncbi:hypothetical protein TEA_022368 [Camellia sinensis var. sinensis]|uniref:inorganic diphosphatase n=1 Tax=Camellia sinensis var. sinensis TaxID=542762 RepID=A0A4S4EID7_CAMSN|nr:hypothetical protein TEA_022368 [Camellia sinensis var. sinensis]
MEREKERVDRRFKNGELSLRVQGRGRSFDSMGRYSEKNWETSLRSPLHSSPHPSSPPRTKTLNTKTKPATASATTTDDYDYLLSSLIRDDIEEDAFRGLCAMVSPWHDIPLHLGDGVFNFIVEIPKETSAKMEVATDESYTPIKQYTKKGKLRYYPYNINWNYGLFPQMWEDPSFANSEVEGALGDNDPVDVVEIGQTRGKIGQIMKVKPLAALAMLDEGELDWKIVAISLDDPRASLVNDIDDVDKHLPVMFLLN